MDFTIFENLRQTIQVVEAEYTRLISENDQFVKKITVLENEIADCKPMQLIHSYESKLKEKQNLIDVLEKRILHLTKKSKLNDNLDGNPEIQTFKEGSVTSLSNTNVLTTNITSPQSNEFQKPNVTSASVSTLQSANVSPKKLDLETNQNQKQEKKTIVRAPRSKKNQEVEQTDPMESESKKKITRKRKEKSNEVSESKFSKSADLNDNCVDLTTENNISTTEIKINNLSKVESEMVIQESNQLKVESEVVVQESNQTKVELEVLVQESNQTKVESEVVVQESNQTKVESEMVIQESNQTKVESEVLVQESNQTKVELEVVVKESNTTELLEINMNLLEPKDVVPEVAKDNLKVNSNPKSLEVSVKTQSPLLTPPITKPAITKPPITKPAITKSASEANVPMNKNVVPIQKLQNTSMPVINQGEKVDMNEYEVVFLKTVAGKILEYYMDKKELMIYRKIGDGIKGKKLGHLSEFGTQDSSGHIVLN
jgi:hypothetical protein